MVGLHKVSEYYEKSSAYFKTYILKHLVKLDISVEIPTLDTIFKQLLWFKSYSRLISEY